MHFVDVVIRQAHPGPDVEPYRTFGEKMLDAERYQREDEIPWTVLVDDLNGTVHQVYGGLADPAYLIGTDGRVSFYCMWTNGPTLHEALRELTNQGGRGVVAGGSSRAPQMSSILADGWPALRRGLPQSFIDLELAAPGSASACWAGHQLRPLLSPLAHRIEPVPTSVKIGLAAGAAALAFLGIRALARRGRGA